MPLVFSFEVLNLFSIETTQYTITKKKRSLTSSQCTLFGKLQSNFWWKEIYLLYR